MSKKRTEEKFMKYRPVIDDKVFILSARFVYEELGLLHMIRLQEVSNLPADHN